MIIGVDATNRWIQYAGVSDHGVHAMDWDGVGTIEMLPARIQSLINQGQKPTGGLVILGPGSYTGIRLSLTTMKMLTLVHKVPLMGMSIFDAYLQLNHGIIQGLVLMTSPSRKGVLNAQLFQTTKESFQPISSLLQIRGDEMDAWLKRFQASIYWLHFGDDLIVSDHPLITCKNVRLDLVGLIRHYQHLIPQMTEKQPLFPIYSYPPVMS